MSRRRSRAERFASDLENWSDLELRELIAIAEALLDSRSQADQQPQKRRADGTQLGKKGGTGSIELKTITDKATGKSYGSYKYLRYWGITKSGKKGLKSVYLGKGESP